MIKYDKDIDTINKWIHSPEGPKLSNICLLPPPHKCIQKCHGSVGIRYQSRGQS